MRKKIFIAFFLFISSRVFSVSGSLCFDCLGVSNFFNLPEYSYHAISFGISAEVMPFSVPIGIFISADYNQPFVEYAYKSEEKWVRMGLGVAVFSGAQFVFLHEKRLNFPVKMGIAWQYNYVDKDDGNIDKQYSAGITVWPAIRYSHNGKTFISIGVKTAYYPWLKYSYNSMKMEGVSCWRAFSIIPIISAGIFF